MSNSMQIQLFHDTACPWCRIGKRHLQIALSEWLSEAVTVRYLAFFLNPSIPVEGYDFQDYMWKKGGGRVPLEQWFAAPRTTGQQVGLTFNFEQITQAPNTSLSHQLIAITPDAQRHAMIDAIYRAYFEHGRNIGDLNVLSDLAAEQGLNATDIKQQMQSATAQQRVQEDIRAAQRLGVTGVPFFVFDNRLALSGAQPPEVIYQTMEQASHLSAQEYEV